MATTDIPTNILYHFCRLRLPSVVLPRAVFDNHLHRAYELYRVKQERQGQQIGWATFLQNVYALDLFLACACLEGLPQAWQSLFAARANRSDCLLVDALRARAVRLYPRNQEHQEQAVLDFWGYLLAGEREGSVPILARYDGQRPLVPWLIRVFQNKHLSDLRHDRHVQPLPEEELDDRDLPLPHRGSERWYEEFRLAARDWLAELNERQILILGLRWRYRLSQREAAQILGIHEGNVSRETDKLRNHCLEFVGHRLRELGWTGDESDLSGYIWKEMDSLLLDEPRLSADRLAALLKPLDDQRKRKGAAGRKRDP